MEENGWADATDGFDGCIVSIIRYYHLNHTLAKVIFMLCH